MKAFQQELHDYAHVFSTCMRAQSHLCKKKKFKKIAKECERGGSVHIYVPVMGEQAATAHLTLKWWRRGVIELLEGGETGSSSLHTSLFKGTIKVWQKCQCCRQGTGL